MQQTTSTPAQVADLSPRKQQILSHLLGRYQGVGELRRSIVCVRLHIRRCRFVTRFDLEDLGITVEDETVRNTLDQLMIFGEKRLLPKAYMTQLNRLESGARYALKERAFRTEMGTFVPYTTYSSCKQELDQFKGQYFALRDELLRDYQLIKRQTLSEYDVIGRDAYQRICASRPELLVESPETFVANYCNRIGAQIPTPEKIRASFDFKVITFDEFLQFSLAPEQEHESVPISWVQEQRQTAREQDWQREAIARDLRLHAQERLAILDSVKASLVSQLRAQTYEAVCDVLATIKRRSGESFAPQSVTQLKHLMERVSALNFYGDGDIERIIVQMQEICTMSPQERKHSMASIQETLRAIGTSCRATLLDLEEEPSRSARDLDIPDLPSGEAVRQARKLLGLEMDAVFVASPQAPRAARQQGALPDGSLWEGIDLGTVARLHRVER